MKYINTDEITLTAGYPPSKKGLDFLQEEAKEAIAMLTNQLIGSTYVANTPYSIYGCERSGASSPYDYTAGVVFYNGELYDFPALSAKAISITDVCVITSTADATADPTELTDGSSVNMHFSRDIVVTSLAVVTNGVDSFNYSDMVKLQSDWHIVDTAGEPAYEGTWATTGSDAAGFKKNTDNTLSLRGVIDTGADTTTVFTLPEEYRPATQITVMIYNIAIFTGGLAHLTITTGGAVSVNYNSSNDNVSLYNVRIPLD
jgi:hypothetical protein